MSASRPQASTVADGSPANPSAGSVPLVRRSTPAPSRVDQVAAQLAEVIAKLKPGERLGTKAELREQAGVSIGTFNETLRVLQAQGMIEVRRGPHGGLFVAERSPMAQLGHAVLQFDINAAAIAEAMDIRDALDPLLIADAVLHSSAHQVKLMRKQLARMDQAVREHDGIAFLHANWQLHAAIADVSPRPILKTFYVTLLNMIEEHTIAVADDRSEQTLANFHRDRYSVHAQLVDAIENRDADKAREMLHQHNAGIARPTA